MDILNERLELLRDIKDTLISDRKFHLGRKDWPKVKVCTDMLKKHKEQVAMVLHMKGEINRGARA
jgi:hypothetical protein